MIQRGNDLSMSGRAVAVSAVGLCIALFAVSGCSDGYVPSADADTEVGADVDEAPDTGGPDDVDSNPPDDTGDEGMDTSADTSKDVEDEDDGGGSTGCTQNGDGVIERDEVTFEPGLKATFKVAHDVEVDTQGMMKDGGRYWDYDRDYPGDEFEIIAFQSMQDAWFKSDFPDGDYAMKLAGDSEELGIFDATPKGLYLLGLVSPEEGSFGETNISYDPPVEILRFPLEEGASWKTETTAEGTHETYSPNFEISWNETYRNQVDAAGTVDTPFGELDVLRVRTVLERNQRFSGFTLGKVRTFAFVAECFGTVATIRSDDGEDETEFKEAAEIRRLSR